MKWPSTVCAKPRVMREFAGTSLRVADEVRVLGIVLPLLALVALVGAVVVAPDRRLAAGALLAIALLILEARTLAGVHGEDELTDEDMRGAVAGVLDAFLGDLVVWGLLLALLGLAHAARADWAPAPRAVRPRGSG